MSRGSKKPSSAEMRALRDARSPVLTPAEQARRHEESLLRSLGTAQGDLEWLAVNQGWTLLGFDTCASWWEQRVRPVAEGLGLQPTRELGLRFVELIRQEEAALPTAQRRSTKELADLVGISEWSARPAPRSLTRRNHEYVDLDDETIDGEVVPERPALVDGVRAAIEEAERRQLDGKASQDPTNPPADLPQPPDAVEDNVPVATDGQPETDPEDSANVLGASGESPSSDSSDAAQPPTGPGVTGVGDEPEGGSRQPSSGALKPKRPVETEEEQAARERMEFRTARSLEFAEGLVNLTQRLDDDAVSWFQEVYLLGVYPHRDLPTVRDCFTPPSMRVLAKQLGVLADYLEETGEEL